MSLSISPPSRELSLDEKIKHRQFARMAWVWHILYIVYSLEVGVFLIMLPWLPMWDNNYLIYRFAFIRPIVVNPFLKGAVLGLGIVNILIGIQEVVHFRRNCKAYFPR